MERFTYVVHASSDEGTCLHHINRKLHVRMRRIQIYIGQTIFALHSYRFLVQLHVGHHAQTLVKISKLVHVPSQYARWDFRARI